MTFAGSVTKRLEQPDVVTPAAAVIEEGVAVSQHLVFERGGDGSRQVGAFESGLTSVNSWTAHGSVGHCVADQLFDCDQIVSSP